VLVLVGIGFIVGGGELILALLGVVLAIAALGDLVRVWRPV
jgi:hypothetical protein